MLIFNGQKPNLVKTLPLVTVVIALACPALQFLQVYPSTVGEPFLPFTLVQDSFAEQDVPFDDTDGDDDATDSVLNWVAKLFLWFIYLMLAVLALAGTFWCLTAKGFWPWVVCLFAAVCYAMLLGRYWGYELSLMLFIGLFVAIRFVVVNTTWLTKWLERR